MIEKALMAIDGSKQFMGHDSRITLNEGDWCSGQQSLDDNDQQEIAWRADSWVLSNSGTRNLIRAGTWPLIV